MANMDVSGALTPEQRFQFAIRIVLRHEGGYTYDKDDAGGETNWGITQRELTRVYKRLPLPAYVKDLSRADAKLYYRKQWWEKYHYEAVNALDIGTKIFDMAVNMGPQQAHILTQCAANTCGQQLKIDGIFGGKTIGAINELVLEGRTDDLKAELREEQKSYYEHLVNNKPVLKKFIKGWLKRAAL